MAEQRSIDIYARVSRAGDDRQRSTGGQAADCRAVLDERGLPVGEVFVDNGKSAWDPRVKRKDWHRLMARLESGVSGGVIVFDLARFSRRPIEGERLIEAAERGLTVLDSEGEYDLTSASGKKHFRDQLASAAYESDRLSTRVKRGKKAKAMSGEPNISRRPFGFEADGVTHRQDEAEVLREMVARFLAGDTQDEIVDDLNRRGVTTSTGSPWTQANVKHVLKAPRNAGIVVHRGEHVARLPGAPIIDPADYEKVVATYAARRPGRPPSDAYLCSGIVHCGRCGTRLHGRPRGDGTTYPDGGIKRVYTCMRRNGGCNRLAIDQSSLDEHARELAIAVLSDSRHAAAIEQAAAERATIADKLDQSIADLEDLATQLADRLGRGEITLDRYDAATKPLDARITRLRAERDALPDEPVQVDPVASRAEWGRRWEDATTPERRRLLRNALRDRRLIVDPADPKVRDVTSRIRVEPAPR